MLRMFLIGPALLGVIHLGGSVLAGDSQQVVHARPSTVYAGISNAIAGAPKSGTMRFEGGRPVPYNLPVAGKTNEELVLRLMMEGRQGAQVDLRFTPRADGEETLVTAKVDADGAVLREALAGTAKAKLGYAPDWVFNIGLKRTLGDLAQQIERGEQPADPTRAFLAAAEAEAALTPEQRQNAATRPTMDPSAAADRFLGGR